MTTAADSPEIERLKARNLELGEENAGLASEIMDLRDQLAEARSRITRLTPYDQPADVIAVLTVLLPGWPAARWRELARLIEAHRT
jgi:hypothetical protein